MSTRADMSATLQDPDSRPTRSTRNMSIALIGPHIGRRSVVAKAISGAEGRTIREFAVYPDKVRELPRLLEQNFDVVMIDLDSDQNYALQLVQEISATGTVNVIVYSSRNDPTLGIISTQAGACDFLPIPADSAGEDAPSPQPVPERAAPARSLEVHPQARIPDGKYPNEANGQVRPEPPAVPKPNIQPPSPSQQNTAQVRAVTPAGVRAPETVPRPAVVPKPTPRVVSVPRPVPSQNSVQAPEQRPVQSVAQRPVQATIPSPVQSSVQPPIQRPAEGPVQTNALEPAPGVEKQSTPAATARIPGGIQTDADVLELFRYGKGEIKEIKDPDEVPVSNSKKRVFILAGSVAAIAVGAVLFFMRPSPQKARGAQPETQVATPMSATSAETIRATGPAASQPIVKPSPTVPLAAEQVPQSMKQSNQVSSDMMDAQLAAQARISKEIKKTDPVEEPPSAGMAQVSIDSGGGVKDASLGGFGKVNVVPVASQISAGVAEGMAIRKTPPVYPKIAKDSRISGTVVLAATINRSGMLENVHVISGTPMLRGAAEDAVKTWRYRPYLLNNQPIAVQTTINVVFSLGR